MLEHSQIKMIQKTALLVVTLDEYYSQREDEQVSWSVKLLEVRDGDDHQLVQKHSEKNC